MRRSLGIYDFGPDPSEFPNTQYEEIFLFFFISVAFHLSICIGHILIVDQKERFL